MNIEKIVDEIVTERSRALDAHFATFLKTFGIEVKQWNPATVQKELREKGYVVIDEVTDSGKQHTFKLYKVLGESTITFLNTPLDSE